MVDLLIAWLIASIAVWATGAVLPGVTVRSFGTAVGVAAVFGVLNFLFGWLLFTVIAIGTLGVGLLLAFVTHWVVNAILLWVTDKMMSSFNMRSFGTAMLASLMISVVTTAANWLLA